jgi:hypothetical protein
MKMRSLLFGGLLSLVGCQCSSEAEKDMVRYEGVPLGIGIGFLDRVNFISVVIRNPSKDQIFGRSFDYDTCSRVQAVINSEINDGDQEPIVLFDYENDSSFDCVEANGLRAGYCH